MVESRNGDDLKNVISHLAQRLFDPVPHVRLAVSLVAGDLLLNWPTAYSNCAYLMPLLLTGLDDEFAENAARCRELWDRVGRQWAQEEASRDTRVKDRLDFEHEHQRQVFPYTNHFTSQSAQAFLSRSP